MLSRISSASGPVFKASLYVNPKMLPDKDAIVSMFKAQTAEYPELALKQEPGPSVGKDIFLLWHKENLKKLASTEMKITGKELKTNEEYAENFVSIFRNLIKTAIENGKLAAK